MSDWRVISDELNRELREMFARLTNLAPFWQDVGELLVVSTERRFGTQTGPDGAAWAPNKPITIAKWIGREGLEGKKAERATARKRILRQSGALANSIAYQVGADGVQITSGLKYAGVMQFGAAQGAFGRTRRNGPIPWGNIPARPYVGISDKDRQGIAETLEEHLTGGFGAP
jgi:phage virion morphogenesis protein